MRLKTVLLKKVPEELVKKIHLYKDIKGLNSMEDAIIVALTIYFDKIGLNKVSAGVLKEEKEASFENEPTPNGNNEGDQES